MCRSLEGVPKGMCTRRENKVREVRGDESKASERRVKACARAVPFRVFHSCVIRAIA